MTKKINQNKLDKLFSIANHKLTQEAFRSFLTFSYGSLSCALNEGHEVYICESVIEKHLKTLMKNPDNIYKFGSV